jgi:3-oxoacyl-[acyl-carrier-protein] synthase III
MNAPLVGEIFVPSILKAVEDLRRDWVTQVEPILGFHFSFDRVKRVYFHQANRWRIQDGIDELKLDPRTVPFNLDRYGNTTCTSTFLLLQEDLELGLVSEGDLVVFLLVGAGLGAMYGYGVLVV